MFHFDHWKKQPKQVANFLNENSTVDEFEKFQTLINRLENIVTEDLRHLFSSKDSFIWFSMFNKFSELGLEDKMFAEFLRAFGDGLKSKVINETSYTQLDENRGTKDKAVILAKLNLLTELMCQYLGVNQEFFNKDNLLTFVKENVNDAINEEDIELYVEIAEDLTSDSHLKSIAVKNEPSVISIIAFACENDIDLDNCMVSLLTGANFSGNQKDNYLMMKERLEAYINVSARCF
jgi:hypothetical protein